MFISGFDHNGRIQTRFFMADSTTRICATWARSSHRQRRPCRSRVQKWLQWDGGSDAAPDRIQRAVRRAQDRMVQANLRLVVVAKKYSRIATGTDLLDLIQRNRPGFAVLRSSIPPADKFSTYAIGGSVLTRAISHRPHPAAGSFERGLRKDQRGPATACRSCSESPASTRIPGTQCRESAGRLAAPGLHRGGLLDACAQEMDPLFHDIIAAPEESRP